MHYFENLPPTLHPYISSDLGLQLAKHPSRSKSLKRLQRWAYQSRMMLSLDHHDNQNAANGGPIIFMLARSQLQSSSRYAFRCSSEASTPRTWNAHTDALVCDERRQFWRPQAPTLASYHANAGFAEDFSWERLPGKHQSKQNKFVTAVVTERTKETSKEQKKGMGRMTISFLPCVSL